MRNKLLVMLIPEQSNLSTQISDTQNKSGEEVFYDRAKPEGYEKDAMKKTSANKKNTSLVRVKNLLQEPIYNTIMIDKRLFTLRLLAIA